MFFVTQGAREGRKREGQRSCLAHFWLRFMHFFPLMFINFIISIDAFPLKGEPHLNSRIWGQEDVKGSASLPVPHDMFFL